MRKGMLQRKTLLLTLVVVLFQAGCGSAPAPFQCTDDIGCVEIPPGEPIKIGVIQNLSGAGPPGLFMLHCVELAVEDRGGQLLGHPIEVVSADSKCSGEGGTTAALQVAADAQVVGIVGPSCSGAAVTAMKIVSKAGLVMISGSSSAPSLTSVGGERGSEWQPGFYRTAQNDALAGRVTAIFAFQELGKRKAATINGGDPYTRGLTDTFHQAFAELGGQAVLDAVVNKGDTDMQPVLNAVAASGAELLFFPLYEPEGNYLVLQAAEMEPFEQITLITAEGLYLETFIAAVGQAAVGMYGTVPATPEGREYDAYLAKYKAKYQEPPFPMYAATTYDATNLLVNAIEAVAMQDKNGTLHIGRQALRDALYGTAGHQGVTGRLTCDEYGDCGVTRFHVTRLDDPNAGLAGLEANVVYTYPPEE
jgi:branched-chain amino acid transport system substrate-binding protein